MRWLLIDVSYMCYRAFYTTGGLTYKDISTGVVYGFLRDVLTLCEQHDTNRVVFCFDRDKNLRKEIFPAYKSSRVHGKTPAEKLARKHMLMQMKSLRLDYLPRMGFRNIFSELGYEADDVIASVCLNSLGNDKAYIVSADADLYQLLTGNVSVWSPTKYKLYTLQSLYKEYGVTPSQWAEVKAIAGCKGDDIPGVKGVGEKIAAKYLLGQLKEESVAYKMIRLAREQTRFNTRLVRLPFAGTPVFTLRQDRFSIEGWQSVVAELGIRSMRTADLAIFTGVRRRGLGLHD